MSSHFYQPDGTPAHDADLQTALTLGYLPSVTTVLKLIPHPRIAIWQSQQAVFASEKNPRKWAESDNDYAKRIHSITKVQQQSITAFGLHIHNNLERFNKDPKAKLDFDAEPFVRQWQLWVGKNLLRILGSEISLASSKIGLGGTLDVVASHRELGLVVLDAKTQRVKEKPQFYPTFCWQLAAYAEMWKEKHQLSTAPRIMSTVLDSGDSHKPLAVYLWTPEEQAAGLAIAVACGKIFQAQRTFL